MKLATRRYGVSFFISSTIGMLLLWILFRGQLYTTLFSDTIADSQVSSSSYLLFLAITTLLGVAAFIARHRLENGLLQNPTFLIAFSAAGSVGALIMHLVGDVPAIRYLYIIGMVMLASSTLVLLLSWGVLVASVDSQTGALCSTLACALSFMYYTCPEPLYSSIIIGGSLVSGLLRCLCRVPARQEVARQEAARREADGPQTNRHVLQKGLIAALIICLFVGSVIRGILLVDSHTQLTEYGALKDTVSTVFSLLLFFILLLSRWDRRTFLIIWLVLSILIFMGLALITFLSPDESGREMAAIIPTRALFGFLLWLVIVLETGDRGAPTLPPLITIYLVSELVSAVVTYVLMPQCAPLIQGLYRDSISTVIMIVRFALVGASLFLLGKIIISADKGGDANRSGADGEGEPDTGGRQQEASVLEICQQIGASYNLTPREIETMALIAQGHSVKKIADILTVSSATVQTHSRSLYSKLGVHNRQMVIDMVDNRRQEMRLR